MPIVIDAPRPAVNLVNASGGQASLVFFGTPAFVVPVLRRLVADGWPVVTVVTAPDAPVGRTRTLTPSPVKQAALELGLRVLTPQKLDDAFFAAFAQLRPELCVVAAYNKIIPARVLNQARRGFINVHPSLLPAYRGPSPVRSAILDGATRTGVSIMLIDEQVDHGPILAAEPWEIPGGFDASTCEEELFRLGADLLARTLPPYLAGTLVPQPQDDAAATFTHKFTREDGRLDWSQPAKALADRVRALNPNPGTWTTWNGKTLNILSARPTDGNGTPGMVSRVSGDIIVCCNEGSLTLEVMQLEGSKPMDASAFINGRADFIGATLS